MLLCAGRKSELEEAFKEMDKDNSGKLSVDEIKAQYAKLGMQISDDALEKTISKADADGDGKISYAEFLDIL